MSKSSTATTVIRPQDYAHSPVHYAVATGDHAALNNLLSSIPKLSNPNLILTESQSLTQEHIAEQISAAVDRRDNCLKETPLHLAVRLNDAVSVRALAAAGADISLQNAAGWNPLQEALLCRSQAVVSVLVQHHHSSAWSKWRRRLPRLVGALRRMRDFYMEISFHFESSIVPFVGKIAPSDTYKIWKRDGNLRADTSLAGYDGLKIQRANQSFLFLNDDINYTDNIDIPQGSLIILNHDKKRIYDAFENAGNPLSDTDIQNFCNQTSVYRPGMDVTKAELISRTNWRRQEKLENVGDWKARVYEMHNVIFSFRSRKLNSVDNREDLFSPTCVLPLEIDEESDESFIVAENPRFSVSNDRQRRHSSFVKAERDFPMASRNSVDVIPLNSRRVNEERDYVRVSRKSVDIIPVNSRRRAAAPPCTAERLVAPPKTKEKEYLKSLRPVVWLTEQFPLKTEELLPLLDILANKIKAVRRLRELLTTTFPPSTFPVKVAIPVVPTVKVVITFTKFVELKPVENFYTPLSSPGQFSNGISNEDENGNSDDNSSYFSLSSSRLKGGTHPRKSSSNVGPLEEDPFLIPGGYSWSSFYEKNRKMKRSGSKSSKRTTN